MEKVNCWEYKKCGREPNGAKVVELGECPATVETKLNGVHGGINAGRSCWAIVGTMCGGKVQDSITEKGENCPRCDFFKLVYKEESNKFLFGLSPESKGNSLK
jgi:hypothetical protein